MMADKARVWTDKKLVEMEKEIHSIYAEAQADITRKWDAYMIRGEQRLSKLHEAYMNSGTAVTWVIRDALNGHQHDNTPRTLKMI